MELSVAACRSVEGYTKEEIREPMDLFHVVLRLFNNLLNVRNKMQKVFTMREAWLLASIVCLTFDFCDLYNKKINNYDAYYYDLHNFGLVNLMSGHIKML